MIKLEAVNDNESDAQRQFNLLLNFQNALKDEWESMYRQSVFTGGCCETWYMYYNAKDQCIGQFLWSIRPE